MKAETDFELDYDSFLVVYVIAETRAKLKNICENISHSASYHVFSNLLYVA